MSINKLQKKVTSIANVQLVLQSNLYEDESFFSFPQAMINFRRHCKIHDFVFVFYPRLSYIMI